MDKYRIDPSREPDEAVETERAALFARTAPGARKLAARLEDDPATMAWVLARYREVEDMSDDLIALSLGIDADRVPHLALCNRPREQLFRTDVESIAVHVGMVDPLPLAQLVRRVDALTGFGQRTAGHRRGFLAAARDRAAEDPAIYDPSISTTQDAPPPAVECDPDNEGSPDAPPLPSQTDEDRR